jgi:hypothetical protein
VLIVIGNLALTKRDQGKQEEAKRLKKQVLKLCKKTGDKEGPNVFIAIGNLALTKQDQGKLEEAERL